MPPRRPLTAHSAQITTAAIEIKTLTVGGKQVTLAVFRQLYNEPLYDPLTWEAAGVPWCRVNYHPDKCAGDREHEHIVWQKGDELRRTRIDYRRDGLWDVPVFGYDDGAVLCLKVGHHPDIQIDRAPVALDVRGEMHVSFDRDGGRAATKLHIKNHRVAEMIIHRAGLVAFSQAHAEHHTDPAACAEARAAIEQRARQSDDWLANADRCWDEVQNLDQVFIAV
ncbi:hypothetical protein [Protofrankia symbiont of Coriaria ruscifolia]|uniref:hypothetical protein n=1 Tax=Protofrankia symbiont of Coriaria ruscifolia TaxID=1306542 RepID=UPI0010410C62|nr:hypothetical protein [Protofrankia symbiont of Coriaria ruscifolia]